MGEEEESKSEIKQRYVNLPLIGSFNSAKEFIRSQKLHSRPKRIKEILSELDVYSLHVPFRKKFPRR